MILNNDEIILKEILPSKSFFFNLTERIRIIISFVGLAISIFMIVMAIGFFVFSLIAISFFCMALYNALLRWVLRYMDLKNNYYLITNQRIIIAKRSKKEILRYKNLGEIDQIHAEMNDKYFGNIIFGEPEGVLEKPKEPVFFGGNRSMIFKDDEYAFLSVEHIDDVIIVLEGLKLRVDKIFY